MSRYVEVGMKQKRIIKMLHNTRVEQKVQVGWLCNGICTKSMLEKIERGDRFINRNSLNRLLSRLGIDQKKYEKYLDYMDYDEWKDRNDIINAIEDGKLQRAEELLKKYDETWTKNRKIEKQFYIFMKLQILQKENPLADSKEIYNLYKEAATITIPDVNEVALDKMLLSTDEVNLVLECRSREIHSKDVLEIFAVYRELLDYMDSPRFDIGGRAKICPKIVVYMYRHVKIYEEKTDERKKADLYEKILLLCDKAIDILREDCKSYYLSELLNVHIELLTYLLGNTDDINKIDEYKRTLHRTEDVLDAYKGICEQYNMPYVMEDCCYFYREEDVYCINDVIKKRRKMLNMTRAELCDGICSERTVQRLELKQKRKHDGIAEELFCCLGLSVEYINMGIVTDSRETTELYERYRRAVNAKEMDLAEEFLNELEEKLPQCTINKQMMLRSRSLVQWLKGQITCEQHINNLKEAISCTVDLETVYKKQENAFFSWLEISCMNSTATALKKIGMLQESYKYISILKEYFDKFAEDGMEDVYVGLYEIVMSFYASLMGSMGEYKESNRTFDKLNKLSLKLKRTNLLHYNIYNVAWNRRESGKSPRVYITEVQRCINLCQLVKSNYYEDGYRKRLG